MAAGDTIFAVASGAGRTAVTVLRISGPATGAVLDRLTSSRRPPPRTALLRTLRDERGEMLDRSLVLWFPGPRSYTGEDCAELHLHGGSTVASDVADALVALGARPAEAGEFTRRAFLNGKMDLVQAEAVADLVEAETSAQRRQALRQLEGELGALYAGWQKRLLTLLAHQEALIDFPDEDLPESVEAGLLVEVHTLRDEIARHLADGGRGERLRSGLVFAVVGAPNAGKSTLINALARRDVAIVSHRPGTTRDVLEARMLLGEVPVTLLDTAGLRDSDDAIEAEGVRRALQRAAAADLIVQVSDGPMPETLFSGPALRLLVASKADLRPRPAWADLSVSAVTGEGMAALERHLAELARSMTSASGPPPLTRPRHRSALREAEAALARAEKEEAPELRGEELRWALSSLGRITGHVGVKDVLDVIFGAFCIGK
jgi:tRNA modification GTPase